MINTQLRNAPRPFFSSVLSVCVACTMLVAPALGQSEANDADVNITDYGTIDLAVQDTDLAQVLQMLSIQSEKNIITSRNVSATVTANLYDVTFHEALDSILRVNGYGYIEEGNFVYIYTKAELEEIERAQRRTESRIFELEYLSARDAEEFVRPLLSADGGISVRGEVERGFQPGIDDGGADEYAFSAKIVVNDFPEHLDAIAELIEQLDTSPRQVLVEATVLRTTLDEDNAFGIDFSIIGNMNFTDLFNPLSGVNDLLLGNNEPGAKATDEVGFQPLDNRARAVTSTVGQTRGPGGLKVGIIRDDVSVFLRVLDEVTDTSILARPKIMALNRQRAEVLVGERVPFRSTTATDTSTTQNVEFLNTGIELTFRPFISRSGMIRMELKPKVSFAIREEIAEGETAPREFTNELTTNVRVQDGQTLVLGGLFQEEIDKTRRQIPILGDVPLFGAPFRGHEDTVRRSEIIFLITPTIVEDETLWDMGRESLVHAESVQLGARKGLLPFSRERITGSYNRRAVEALNRGDVKKAHYYINNSLRLNSNQPEMIRLRQEVTGVREKAFERSVLERVLRKHLGSPMEGLNTTHSWRGQQNIVPHQELTIGESHPKQSQKATASTQKQMEAELETSDQVDQSDLELSEQPEHVTDGAREDAELSHMPTESPDTDLSHSTWPLSELYIRFGFPNFFSANQSDMHADRPGDIAGAAGADQFDK